MATKKHENKAKADEKHEAEGHAKDGGHEAHAADEHGHGHEDEAEEDSYDNSDDPMWWTPHAVLFGLLLLGVSSMLGLLNPYVGKYFHGAAAHGAEGHAAAHGPDHAKQPTPPGTHANDHGAH